jgi:phosphoribosylformylglycinamidine synthase subunit PurS
VSARPGAGARSIGRTSAGACVRHVEAIADALHSLGYGGVEDVRQGKYFELDLNVSEAGQARALAAEVADKLLANPVIESYRIEVGD